MIARVRERGITLTEVTIVFVLASLVMQLGAESVFVGSGIFMQDSTRG